MKDITPEHCGLEDNEEAHRLSFCNLITQEMDSGPITNSSRTSSARTDHLFEFFVHRHGPVAPSTLDDIVFCGKVFHAEENDEDGLNEYEKRDYFANIRSRSDRKSLLQNRTVAAGIRRRAASNRFPGEVLIRPKRSIRWEPAPPGGANISSLASMSARSRRWMFMFGPMRFRPEMEMGAVKRRQQGRRPREETAAGAGGGRRQWGLVGSSLRGRSTLATALVRSLGCIPVAGGGVEGWVGGPL